ncbi:MAG: hypothetical protein ACRDYC_02580 [Acidimicrobiales bacterium]
MAVVPNPSPTHHTPSAQGIDTTIAVLTKRPLSSATPRASSIRTNRMFQAAAWRAMKETTESTEELRARGSPITD